MDNRFTPLMLHPKLLDMLFAHKRKVNRVFEQVIGIHDVDHLSIYKITSDNKLLCFSSTASLEYNLFSKPLWHFDRTFHPQWFMSEQHNTWDALYLPARFDELYYLKQIKPRLPVGISIARTHNDHPIIFSIASHQSNSEHRLNTCINDLADMGQYCCNELHELFESYNHCTLTTE